MPHILIDEQKAVEFTPILHERAHGVRTITLSFGDTYRVLDEWAKLAQERRGFRFGGEEDDTEPDKVVIAEAVGRPLSSPRLALEELHPFWDGERVHNEYELDRLSDVLGVDTLKWGMEIDEEDIF